MKDQDNIHFSKGIKEYNSITFSFEVLHNMANAPLPNTKILTTFTRILEHGVFDKYKRLVFLRPGDKQNLTVRMGVNGRVLRSRLKEMEFSGLIEKLDHGTFRINSKHVKINYK